MKGDSFKGMFWLRFATPLDAMNALAVIKNAFQNEPSNMARCNFDLSIEERVVNGFLFGLKSLLVD